jgi:hypothetical protein
MPIRTPRPALFLFIGATAFVYVGCNPAQKAPSATGRANPDAAPERSETQSMAEAAMGKQAEVLEQGDLARNGLEQVLAINRLANARHGVGNIEDAASPAGILILRAAIFEKSGGKWTEVLRCDERLKNPNGYLAGSPAARVSGWRLQYNTNASRGLEMKFTPADIDMDTQETGSSESPSRAVTVRWNIKAKRYQSLDAFHEKYLSEVPTLETPLSILK